jgi:xanthine dehydrogenase YagR molybdenum-binding subunit
VPAGRAQRFGWAQRDAKPRARRDGSWLTGTGVAASTFTVYQFPAAAFVQVDRAGYYQATNADVGAIDATWIDEQDPHVNPMGSKGMGEIGIVGTAAAIANAVYHATGIRVRDLPITLDKLLR